MTTRFAALSHFVARILRRFKRCRRNSGLPERACHFDRLGICPKGLETRRVKLRYSSPSLVILQHTLRMHSDCWSIRD